VLRGAGPREDGPGLLEPQRERPQCAHGRLCPFRVLDEEGRAIGKPRGQALMREGVHVASPISLRRHDVVRSEQGEVLGRSRLGESQGLCEGRHIAWPLRQAKEETEAVRMGEGSEQFCECVCGRGRHQSARVQVVT
jgi:hypothetical protein